MAEENLLPGNILSMTGQAADRLLAAGNGDAALLYLLLLRGSGRYDEGAALRTLHWDGPRLASARAALVSMALARQESSAPPVPAPPPEAPPRPRRQGANRSTLARAYWTPERREEHGARLREAFARTREREP